MMPTKRGTILVVDDEEAVRALVSILLKRDGYHVLVAADYDQAIAVQRENQNQLDLLLTDISLPGKSGLELAAAALSARPDLKVMYMSGATQFEAFEPDGEIPPGSSFLAKPFRSEELLGQVNVLIEEPAMMQAATNGGQRTSRRK